MLIGSEFSVQVLRFIERLGNKANNNRRSIAAPKLPFVCTASLRVMYICVLVPDGSTFLAPKKRPSFPPQEGSVSDRNVHDNFRESFNLEFLGRYYCEVRFAKILQDLLRQYAVLESTRWASILWRKFTENFLKLLIRQPTGQLLWNLLFGLCLTDFRLRARKQARSLPTSVPIRRHSKYEHTR